jgi:hypothetical protein
MHIKARNVPREGRTCNLAIFDAPILLTDTYFVFIRFGKGQRSNTTYLLYKSLHQKKSVIESLVKRSRKMNKWKWILCAVVAIAVLTLLLVAGLMLGHRMISKSKSKIED